MRYAIISLIVSCLVISGCDAPQTGPASTPSSDFNDGYTDGDTGPWYDGNGNPVDEPPDVFLEVDQFTLVAMTVGAGAVEPYAGTFENGEEVTLTATPDSGWYFDHWEGDASGTDAVITIAVVADTVVVAWFVNIPTPIENDNDNGGGDEDDDEEEEDDEEEDTTIDPGDSFASAPLLDLGSNGSIVITQTLVRASDVHVYDLGLLASGDRLTATCEALSGSQLDPMTALFDADGYRVFWNDDIDLTGGDYDSILNDLIRHDSDHHYLAVTSTDYEETTGDYQLTIEIESGAAFPQVSGQTIVIDLDGATDVVVAGYNWGNFDAFDAEAIDPSFAGQTEALKQVILSIVEADYAQYDVTVLTTDDPTPTGSYTIVYLGGDSDILFGIADHIDFYNDNHGDNCIVFAEAFGGLSTDLNVIGQAIGNVISHEVGHDLGLMHTTDVTTLMDTTGTADTLLVDQQFGIAEVYDFPIGSQNAPLLLEESLGLLARPRLFIEDGYLRCGTCGAKLFKLSDLNANTHQNCNEHNH